MLHRFLCITKTIVYKEVIKTYIHHICYLFYLTIHTQKMYGGGYGQYGGGMGEMRSDMWINQNIPGGINSNSSFSDKIKMNLSNLF